MKRKTNKSYYYSDKLIVARLNRIYRLRLIIKTLSCRDYIYIKLFENKLKSNLKFSDKQKYIHLMKMYDKKKNWILDKNFSHHHSLKHINSY